MFFSNFCIENVTLMVFQATEVTQDFFIYKLLFLFFNSSDSLLSGSLVYLETSYFFLNIFVCIFILSFLHPPIPELFFSHKNANRLSVCGRLWDAHNSISFSQSQWNIIFLSLSCSKFGPQVNYFVLYFQGKVKRVHIFKTGRSWCKSSFTT